MPPARSRCYYNKLADDLSLIPTSSSGDAKVKPKVIAECYILFVAQHSLLPLTRSMRRILFFLASSASAPPDRNFLVAAAAAAEEKVAAANTLFGTECEAQLIRLAKRKLNFRVIDQRKKFSADCPRRR